MNFVKMNSICRRNEVISPVKNFPRPDPSDLIERRLVAKQEGDNKIPRLAINSRLTNPTRGNVQPSVAKQRRSRRGSTMRFHAVTRAEYKSQPKIRNRDRSGRARETRKYESSEISAIPFGPVRGYGLFAHAGTRLARHIDSSRDINPSQPRGFPLDALGRPARVPPSPSPSSRLPTAKSSRRIGRVGRFSGFVRGSLVCSDGASGDPIVAHPSVIFTMAPSRSSAISKNK